MEKKPLLRKSQKIVIVGFCMYVFGIVSISFILPSIFKSQVKKQIALNNGWPMRKTWSKSSLSKELHVYIFNVTNPEEISKGKKATLHEFGPYVYDVREEKLNIVDHEEDDTLSYTTKHTYFFNVAKSNGLSDQDEYILPNFLILSTANGVLRNKSTVLPLIARSADGLLSKPASYFVKVNVKTYIFDGFRINCVAAEDWFLKELCNDFRDNWYNYRMKKFNDNLYTTATWVVPNATTQWVGESRIRRGVKNISEVGELVEFNKTNNFAKWSNGKCDAYAGTDGTIFRPFLKKRDKLYVSNIYLCRTFPYQYNSSVEHAEMKLLRYITTVGSDVKTYPDDTCYCLSPDQCLKSGVFELSKCLNWSLVASNPHFYLADPYFTKAVVGLDPDKEKHAPSFDVDPVTGIVVRSNFRLQMNVPLLNQLSNFPETILPMYWYEEKIVISESLMSSIKTIHTVIKVEKIISYVITILGWLMFVTAVGYEIKQTLCCFGPPNIETTAVKVQINNDAYGVSPRAMSRKVT